ncbi:ATP-binding protein [Azospirillum sp. ST 5-10]|uniref:ATP-binding protein n=1 Tax=unclassified Azospirillum TaxID=2630922 RepID=UPI003F49C8D8
MADVASVFRTGVAGRVFGALALNGLVALVIGLGAYIVLGDLHRGISDVTSRHFPAVVASAKLERQHQRIMRALEQLALAKDNLTRSTVNQSLSDLQNGYDLMLTDLAQQDGRLAAQTRTLQDMRDEIVRIRQTIDRLVERRIAAGNAVRESSLALQGIEDRLAGLGVQEPADPVVQRWRAAAQRVLYLLISSYRVENTHALSRLAAEAASEMTALTALSGTLDPGVRERLDPLLAALQPIALGDGAIYSHRQVQLDAEESLSGMVDRANQVSLTNTGLNTAIFVEKTAAAERYRQDIIGASVTYTRLFSASAGIVLVGGLLTFLYIQRSVVARLWNVRQALRAKAEDGDAEIPADGSDEIAELARALRFYIHETEVKGEALRRNERWLRAVLEATPVPLVIAGRDDGQIRFVNRRAVDLFGAAAADRLVGRPVRALWGDGAVHDAFVGTIRERQQAIDFEAELVAGDGRTVWGLLSGLAFPFQGEDVLLISVVDITRRREAEELLLRTQVFMDAVIDNVPSVLYVLDGDSGTVVLWNHAAERAFGIERAGIHGRRLDEALGDGVGGLLWRAGGALPETDELVLDRGGERRTFAVRRHPFTWSGDGRHHVIGIANDVTASHQAREELRLAKERAERADAAKTEFLATVSHEMRTPLNGILGLARLLVTGSLAPADRRHAHSIMRCGMTLLDHVNDILDLRKIEDGKLELDPAPCVLRPLLDDVLVTVESLAEEKGVALRLAIDDAVPAAIVIDEQRLRQILINLVGNAVKFTDRGGIDIAVERAAGPAGERLRLTVRDTGIGIPADRLSAIFEKLEQADASIARRFGGSGLGLAIVRHLVDAMGGTIAVASTVGRGSAFTVEVALVPAAADAGSAVTAGTALQPVERSLTLLLVEDAPINQEIALGLLGDAGHRPVLAATGEEALALATARAFDAILLDMRLPDIDGVEVARRIRRLPDRRRAAVPIIAVTANVFVGARARYLEAGIDAIVEKPLFPDRMIQALSGVLAGRRPPPSDAAPDAAPGGAPVILTLDEGGDAGTAPLDAALLDAGALDRYARSLGPRRFAAIRRTLLATLSEGLARLTDPALPEDGRADAAHLLAGSASHFGLTRFVESMRTVEDHLRAGRAAAAAALIAGAPDLLATTVDALEAWCAARAAEEGPAEVAGAARAG